MSSNNTVGFPPGSPGSDHHSALQEIFISFAALSSLFMALWLLRCFLRRTVMRRASFRESCNTVGLNPAALAALATFPYKRCTDNKNGDGENNGSSTMECPICLSAVEEGEMVKLLPECKHCFHADCVDLWLRGHTTCPVCRIQVLGNGRVIRQPNRVQIAAVLDLERQT